MEDDTISIASFGSKNGNPIQPRNKEIVHDKKQTLTRGPQVIPEVRETSHHTHYREHQVLETSQVRHTIERGSDCKCPYGDTTAQPPYQRVGKEEIKVFGMAYVRDLREQRPCYNRGLPPPPTLLPGVILEWSPMISRNKGMKHSTTPYDRRNIG